jgi:hypothetical protein
VGADVGSAAFHVNDEIRPRMHGRQRRDLQRVEDAEDVELSFLRKIRRIGEESERNAHSAT